MIIGPSQYSKDPGIMPEGIAVTLPVIWFEETNTDMVTFPKAFDRLMAREDSLWNFKLTNLPTREIAWVYMIWDKHIQCRLNFVQYERECKQGIQRCSGRSVTGISQCQLGHHVWAGNLGTRTISAERPSGI